MKKLTNIALSLALLLTLTAPLSAGAANEATTEPTTTTPTATDAQAQPVINVTVKGNVIDFPDAKPFLDENNRTLVPIRFIGEALGCEVEWKESLKRARFTYQTEKPGAAGQITIDFFIGKNTFKVTRGNILYASTPVEEISMDTTALLSDDRTFVPVRYLAEAIGAVVSWDGANQTVSVDYEIVIINGFEIPGDTTLVHEEPSGSGLTNEELKRKPELRLKLAILNFTDDREERLPEVSEILIQKYSQKAVDAIMQQAKDYLLLPTNDVTGYSTVFSDTATNTDIEVLIMKGTLNFTVYKVGDKRPKPAYGEIVTI
jgi:hypothetical protein